MKREYEDYKEDFKRRVKRPARECQDAVETLNTNAFQIVPNDRFKALHIFSVSFQGPRPLDVTDEMLKKRIFCHKSIQAIMKGYVYFVQYRDEQGLKLLIVDVGNGKQGNTMKELVESLKGFSVLIRDKGEEHEWKVEIVEEKNSPVRILSQNADRWAQLISHIGDMALSKLGFSLTNKGRRIARLDEKIHLEKFQGALAAGFSKAVNISSRAALWLFSPKTTLLYDRTVEDEYMTLIERNPLLAKDENALRQEFQKLRLTVYTEYNITNMYSVLTILPGDKPTDIAVKQGDTKISYLQYLQTRYYGRAKMSPHVEHSHMALVRLLTKSRSGAKNRAVKIPAVLLRVAGGNIGSNLSTPAREEIIRKSQIRTDEALQKVSRLSKELDSSSEVREIFDSFGLELRPRAMEVTPERRMQVEVNNGTPLPVKSTGDFLQAFTGSRRHLRCPRLGRELLVIVQTRRNGEIPHDLLDGVLSAFMQQARQLQWDLFIPTDVDVIPYICSQQLEETCSNVLMTCAANETYPKLIIGIISQKEVLPYADIKRFALRLGVPSQVITETLMKRLGAKCFWKLFCALNAKCASAILKQEPDNKPPLQPQPWTVGNVLDTGMVAVGISTYRGKDGRAGWGVCATYTPEATSVIQEFEQVGDLALSRTGVYFHLRDVLSRMFRKLWVKKRHDLESILIFRSGLSDGAFEDVRDVEARQVKQALASILGQWRFHEKSRQLELRHEELFNKPGEYGIELVVADGKSHVVKVEADAELNDVSPDKPCRYVLRTTLSQELAQFTQPPTVLLQNGKKWKMKKEPDLHFVIATAKSANASFSVFRQHGDPASMRGFQHAPAYGSVIDLGICEKGEKKVIEREFYLTHGAGVSGHVNPTHYAVLTDNRCGGDSIDLEAIALKLSFLFFNQQGSCRVPYVLKLAETAAEKAATIYAGMTDILKKDQQAISEIKPSYKKNGELKLLPSPSDALKETHIFL